MVTKSNFVKFWTQLVLCLAIVAFSDGGLALEPGPSNSPPQIGQISVAEECLDPDYEFGLVLGGILGTQTAITYLAIAGLGKVSLAAGATTAGILGSGVGMFIIVDCATTFCIGSVIVGFVAGVAAAWAWLRNKDPEDCSGAVYFSEQGNFYASWNHDSNSIAMQKTRERCEERFGPCEQALLFRHCGAMARDVDESIWAAASGRTAEAARRNALQQCSALGAKSCEVEIGAACNSG